MAFLRSLFRRMSAAGNPQGGGALSGKALHRPKFPLWLGAQDDVGIPAAISRKVIMQDNPIYPGDAIYAYFDGYGIELKLNHHASPCLIYLEPDVMEALGSFWARMQARGEASK